MNKNKSIWTIVPLLALTACTGGSSGSGSNSGTDSAASIDYSRYSAASTVCSPLNGTNPSQSSFITYTNGLVGQLFSLNPGAATPQTLSQLFATSSNVGIDLFLDDLNVPTRPFTEGFPAANGQLLTDASGNVLLEYFGMQLSSSIQLSPGDAEGDYQFALISDDGSTLSMKTLGNNTFTTLLDDDGTHPSLMKCATSPVTIHNYDQIPIQLQYFQGPRYNIALMLMWRPWPKNSADVLDPLCGAEGNDEFFDQSTNPTTPTQNYQDLLARGWKPLIPSNYVIPELGFNPCAVPDYFTAQ